MAYVFEAAGGAASNGTRSPVGERPKSLAERSPIFVGSPEEIQALERRLQLG